MMPDGRGRGGWIATKQQGGDYNPRDHKKMFAPMLGASIHGINMAEIDLVSLLKKRSIQNNFWSRIFARIVTFRLNGLLE